jgi:hypothetical protein
MFKRLFACLIIPISLCIALSACGSDDDQATPPAGSGPGTGQPGGTPPQLKCAP